MVTGSSSGRNPSSFLSLPSQQPLTQPTHNGPRRGRRVPSHMLKACSTPHLPHTILPAAQLHLPLPSGPTPFYQLGRVKPQAG